MKYIEKLWSFNKLFSNYKSLYLIILFFILITFSGCNFSSYSSLKTHLHFNSYANSFSEYPKPNPTRPNQSTKNKHVFPHPTRPNKFDKTRVNSLINQKLISSITVKKGDTLFGLAQSLRLQPRDIINLNGLKSPYRLLKGQTLEIPPSRIYRVKKGDSLYKISRKFGINQNMLAKRNMLQSPYFLIVGDRLYLPEVNYKNTKIHKKSQIISFLWPLKGKIISNFGSKQGGTFNEGINISAPLGTRVSASADGIVVYTGSELKGYGKLILIRHNQGWVSGYAHNDNISVNLGDSVKAGELIARVGKTGNVMFPQSYFELRKKGKAVDPLKFLPK